MNEKNEYNTLRPFQKTLQSKRNTSYEKNKNGIHMRKIQQANIHLQEKRSEQKNHYENHAHARYKDLK